MFHVKILCQNLGHSSFWNPEISFSFSYYQSLIFVDCSLCTFNILRRSACCRTSRMCITFNRFSTIFEALVPHFSLCCTHGIIPESLLNHPNSFHGGMFKLHVKFDADSLLYLLRHSECDGHTVHVLTQWCLLPLLTSTVRSSLCMQAHSSPLSLAAGLHPCRMNSSCCINSGWAFSGQTAYVG